MKHNFTNGGWGNNLTNDGACWSFNGAVQSGDFFQIDNIWYRAIEAHPCGDPKDMSFIKSYVTIGETENGEDPTEADMEEAYQERKDSKTIHQFPLGES